MLIAASYGQMSGCVLVALLHAEIATLRGGFEAASLTEEGCACFKLRSVALMNGNGSAAQQILALTAAFRDRGLSFRHFPQSKVEGLKWQAGREVVEPVTLPDGAVRMVERFELVGWASTSGELINQLA